MRLKYAFKFWFNAFLIVLGVICVIGLLRYNPTTVEIAEYGDIPMPRYYGLFIIIIRLLPYLFLVTLIFFPVGLLLYHPQTLQDDSQTKKIFRISSLKKKSMIPAYLTTSISYGALYWYATNSDSAGMGILVTVLMMMIFLVILVPVNVYVWVISMRRSRE